MRRILYLHAGLAYTPKVFAKEKKSVEDLLSKRKKKMHPSRRRP